MQDGEFCKGESASQILLTGATGLVDGHLPRLLQNEPSISTIAAPMRRPLAPTEGVFNPHDPQLAGALAQIVDPVNIVFCCLGTMRRETGSKEAFVHTDYTLIIDTALAGERLGAQHVLMISAMGANTHPPFFYNQVKGEMKAALAEQAWPRLAITRPSILSGERGKKRTNEAFLEPLFRLLPGNWKAIPARDVAIALLAEALPPSQRSVQIPMPSQLRKRAARRAE